MATIPDMPKFTTDLRETGYISEEELRAKLVELFGDRDFRISVGLAQAGLGTEQQSDCQNLDEIR